MPAGNSTGTAGSGHTGIGEGSLHRQAGQTRANEKKPGRPARTMPRKARIRGIRGPPRSDAAESVREPCISGTERDLGVAERCMPDNPERIEYARQIVAPPHRDGFTSPEANSS